MLRLTQRVGSGANLRDLGPARRKQADDVGF
jgi:hypothetical protein